MSAEQSRSLLELMNPEGGSAYEANVTQGINPQLQSSIDHFQSVLASALTRLNNFDRSAIVVAVGLATSIEVGVTTAVNVILPDMQGNVSASADEISWVVTIYSAAFLSALPINTSIARYIGHRNHLLLALLLYSLGAIGCFASHDLAQLLTARALMGFGGGAFLVRSQATLYHLFQGKALGKQMAVFGIVLCLAKAFLPWVFGEIADHGIWNDAFLLAVPMALASATLIFLFVPEELELFHDAPKPDGIGIFFLVLGITTFQIFISRGEQDGWLASSRLDVVGGVSLIALIAFVARDLQRSNPNPLLNLRVLVSQHSLSGGLGIAFMFGVMLGSGLYVLPQYLRNVQGYSASQTGEFFMLDGFATLAGTLLAGKLLPRLNVRIILLIALAVFLVGNAGMVFTLTPDTPGPVIATLLLFHGMSIGMLLVTAGNFALGAVDLRLISFGASIYVFCRQLGTALGVTATVILIDVRESLHSARLLDTANRFSPQLRVFTMMLRSRIAHLGLGSTGAGADQTFSDLVITQSRLLSYIDVFWVLQLVAIVAALLLLPGSNLVSALRTKK